MLVMQKILMINIATCPYHEKLKISVVAMQVPISHFDSSSAVGCTHIALVGRFNIA